MNRDFANGILVAEIFNRYYPNELLLNLLYTGDSIQQKQSNWSQLAKFFNRHAISVPQEAMEAVWLCHDNAAVQFIENLYTLLTHRK